MCRGFELTTYTSPGPKPVNRFTRTPLGDFFDADRRDGGCAPSRCAALPNPMRAHAGWPRPSRSGRPLKAAYSLWPRRTAGTAHVNFLRRWPLSQCPCPHLARPMTPFAGARCLVVWVCRCRPELRNRNWHEDQRCLARHCIAKSMLLRTWSWLRGPTAQTRKR